MKTKTAMSLACTALLLASEQASAALYDYGQGMVYDSTLNVTWMKDANLLGTQEIGNANLVNQIIAANSGVIADSSGSHNLSSTTDFGSGGQVTWWGA